MRVTHLGSYQAALHRITSTLEAAAGAQDRVATGKRIQRSSDDPTGMAQALELRAALGVREQERRNATDGEMWVNLADSKLQGAVEALQRARELAVRGATFTSNDERAAIAVEIASLREALVEIANTRHQERGVFAGYSTQDAIAKVGGVWTYQGDNGQVTRRIGDRELVAVNVTADEAFGFTAAKDVFTVLDDLEAALLAGDTQLISGAIDEIDASSETMLTSLATLGAAGTRIETAQAKILESIGSVQAQLGALEDVDLSEAILELQMTETAYQAALAAFARSQQSSLVDFLR